MKTTLLFLMLVFGALAIHVDVENDRFYQDSDVEYLFTEVEDSDGLLQMMEQQSQQIDDPTTSPATTSNNIYQFLPPTTPRKTASPSIATSNPMNTENSIMNADSNSWQETVSQSQQVILSEAFFKVYKELMSAYQQNGVTGAFPPLSCQTVVTEQKICFICPPAFGILRMFDSRCNWIPIPAVNSGEPLNRDTFKLMSDDIYEDLRKIYAKLQMNSSAAEPAIDAVQQLDFPVIVLEEEPLEMLPITGDYSTVPTDDLAVTKMVDFAVKELTDNIKTVTSSYVFNGIMSAEKQIVAGVNYRINLDFVDVDGRHLYCSVEVSESLAAFDIPSLINHMCI